MYIRNVSIIYHPMREFQWKKKIYIIRVLRSFYACIYVYIFFRGFIKHTQYSFQCMECLYIFFMLNYFCVNVKSIKHCTFSPKECVSVLKMFVNLHFVYFINKWGVKYRKKKIWDWLKIPVIVCQETLFIQGKKILGKNPYLLMVYKNVVQFFVGFFFLVFCVLFYKTA